MQRCVLRGRVIEQEEPVNRLVQAVIHDEDLIVNKVTNTDPMLLACDNETDICISKTS
jgi:hypothetical protein